MNVLLSIVSPSDPYLMGSAGEDFLAGPLLSIAEIVAINHLIMFFAPALADATEETRRLLQRTHTEMTISAVETPPLPATEDVLPLVHNICRAGGADAEYSFVLSPGHPAIYAPWIALISRGEIDAKVLQVEPAKYVNERTVVTERSDLSAPSSSVRRPMRVREPRATYVADPVATDAPPVIAGRAFGEDSDRDSRWERERTTLGIRGNHPGLLGALQTAAAMADHDVPVLVQGETGTGKGLFARLIHQLSPRSAEPFVPVNCAALPEKLVESILFGHKKGAFTGATQDQVGKFVLAHGGTLFLDEVGELPTALQPKLLKALEDGLVEPLGAAKPRRIDVRVVAATNRDLQSAVAAGTFREDLYYRLSFGIVQLPPLRERRSDIQHIALHCVGNLNQRLRHPKRLSPGALKRLEQQPWRGNVRDLENVIGRSLLLAQTDLLEADDLVIEPPSPSADPLSALPIPTDDFSLEAFLASARKQLILKALQMADGNQSAAARLLNISPQAIHKFLKSQDG